MARLLSHGPACVSRRRAPRRWLSVEASPIRIDAQRLEALPSVGPGVYEIRLHTGVEHRVFYVARFSEAIYVLHAFEKKTRQTRSEDIDVARRRYARLEARRRST